MVAHRPEVSGCTRRRLLSAGSGPEYFLGGRGKFVSGYIASSRPAWATGCSVPKPNNNIFKNNMCMWRFECVLSILCVVCQVVSFVWCVLCVVCNALCVLCWVCCVLSMLWYR